MDELKQDLAATREGLRDVRVELERRPTRKQFNLVVGAAVIVVIVVCIAAYFAVRSASASGEAKGAAEAARTAAVAAEQTGEIVRQGFFISSCRAEVNANTVVAAQQDLDAAIQTRASAIQRRDNLTIEALQAVAQGDDEGVLRVASLAPAARDLVTLTDAIVQDKVAALDKARVTYQTAVDLSISDPDKFEGECQTRGG